MTTLDTNIGKNKPALLRVIFILNALKILLSFGLFIGFSYYGLEVGDKGGDGMATIILWTTLGYIVTFAVMVASILKRSILGARLAFVADVLISLPAQAFIGIVVAIISIGLSFTGPVKAYFSWQKS